MVLGGFKSFRVLVLTRLIIQFYLAFEYIQRSHETLERYRPSKNKTKC